MPFVYPQLSMVAILVAAAAHFVLGFVWYSGLTPIGKRWASEVGMAGTDPGGGARGWRSSRTAQSWRRGPSRWRSAGHRP